MTQLAAKKRFSNNTPIASPHKQSAGVQSPGHQFTTMNSTMKKLEKKIAVLESTIRALIPLAEMGTAHWQEPAKQIEKARKLIKP